MKVTGSRSKETSCFTSNYEKLCAFFKMTFTFNGVFMPIVTPLTYY